MYHYVSCSKIKSHSSEKEIQKSLQEVGAATSDENINIFISVINVI